MGKSWTSIFVSYIYMLACPQTSSLTMQGIILPATLFDAKAYIQVLRIYA